MKVEFQNDEMVVRLDPLERFLAFKLNTIRVPRSAVTRVDRSLPPPTWKEIRIPGTAIPGVIKAGSYYNDRGWEFWYVTRRGGENPVTITLQGQRYASLVLGLPSSSEADRIEEWLRSGAA